MKKYQYVITEEEGMHAIPASIIAKTAREFKSDITVYCGSEKGNMKSMFDIMGMCIKRDTAISIEVSGEDEEDAMHAIIKLIEEL